MVSLVSDPCFFLRRPLIQEQKAGSDWNSRCSGFPLTCQRGEHYKKHHRVKFQVEVEASSGGNVLVDEMASVPPFKHDFGVVDIHHVGVLCENLEKSLEFYQNLLGIKYTLSKSGRPAIFARDPDGNALEFTQGHWRFSSGKEMQGYAYTLTHPGTPAVFYDHIFSGYESEISQLLSLRHRSKLHCCRIVQMVKAERDVYGAIIVEKIAMKIGPGHYEPPSGPQKWSIAAEGRGYKVWESSEW